MRVLLKIQYDGTDFCGWQVQPNGVTVQGVIEEALLKLTGEKITVTGSGRTDSGVHAAAQIAHFDVDNERIPSEKYAAALNGLLRPDVKIIESGLAPDGFHARFSAKKKTYRYAYYISDCELPLKERYAARVYGNIDIEKMDEACKRFIGKHDFRCFLASNSDVKDTIREIYSAKVESVNDEIYFTVTGNGFLYNMVRIMAGTILKAGDGSISPRDIDKIIADGNREKAGKTMPARGLTLISVDYST